jgi:hypothetical protein
MKFVFTAPTARGRIRPLPVETICLRGRSLVPHTSCATPASAPDILSSDAFQDLPSSGAGEISHGMRGGGWSGYACPTADSAISVVKRGGFDCAIPRTGGAFLRDLAGEARCGLVNSSPAKRGKYGEAGMGASYFHVRVRSRSVNPTRPHRLAALPRSTSPVSRGKSCTGGRNAGSRLAPG